MSDTQPLTGAGQNDLSLLFYARHMAETARTAAARQLFRLYVVQEEQRLSQEVRRMWSEWAGAGVRKAHV